MKKRFEKFIHRFVNYRMAQEPLDLDFYVIIFGLGTYDFFHFGLVFWTLTVVFLSIMFNSIYDKPTGTYVPKYY
jgi:hypothetical protein